VVENYASRGIDQKQFWNSVLAKTTKVAHNLINNNMNVDSTQSKKLQKVLVYLISKEHVKLEDMETSFNEQITAKQTQLNKDIDPHRNILNSPQPHVDPLDYQKHTDILMRKNIEKNIQKQEGEFKEYHSKVKLFMDSVQKQLPTNESPSTESQQPTTKRETLPADQAPRSETSESTCSRVYKWLTTDFKGWEAVPKIAAWALLILAGVGIVLLGVVAVSTLIDARKRAFTKS